MREKVIPQLGLKKLSFSSSCMFIPNIAIRNANLFNHTKFLIFDHVLCHVTALSILT